MNNQAIKDAIAALNEAIAVLVKLHNLPPTAPERDQLIDAVCGEMEEVQDILRTIQRIPKE